MSTLSMHSFAVCGGPRVAHPCVCLFENLISKGIKAETETPPDCGASFHEAVVGAQTGQAL